MRDFVAFCLLLACLTVFAASFIALIRPLPKVWLGNRKRALGGFGVSFLLFILTGIVIPSPDGAADKSQETNAAAVAQKVDVEGDRAEDDARKEKVKAEAQQVWDSFLATVKRCDSAGEAVANAASVYSLYDAAKIANRVCSQVSRDVSRLDPPPSGNRDLKKAFNKALDKCRDAYTSKSIAYDKMMDALDEGMKPSAVSDAKSWANYSATDAMACVADLMLAVDKAGVPLESLGSNKS